MCLISFSLHQMPWCVSVAWSPRRTISLLNCSQDPDNNINNNSFKKKEEKGLIQITRHIVIPASSQGMQGLQVRICRSWFQIHSITENWSPQQPPQGQSRFSCPPRSTARMVIENSGLCMKRTHSFSGLIPNLLASTSSQLLAPSLHTKQVAT